MNQEIYDTKALLQLSLKVHGACFLDENSQGYFDAALVRIGNREVVKLITEDGYDCWIKESGQEPSIHKINATESEAISFLMSSPETKYRKA